MSDERFTVPKEKDDEFYWNIIDTENGKVVLQHISLIATREMCTLLNELDYECTFLLEQREHLKEDCKQLEQQYHNLGNAIVKTCNDLNNTEEVYLWDFDICKRITEYEKELSGEGYE